MTNETNPGATRGEGGAESLAARIRREGDLSSRSGQLARLYDLADEADTLRAQLEAAEAEVARLVGCLTQANCNAEEFERKWYLSQDRAEAAEADAARWRFIKAWGRQVEVVGTGECNFGISTPTWRGTWFDLDAAIDAQAATP